MISLSSRPRFSGRLRAALVAVGCALGVASLFAGSASAVWTTNLVQLDNGTCGVNLQIGSDKTASSSNRPTFWLMGDGGLSSYAVAIDGVSIGTFQSGGGGNVCITTSTALSEGAHTLTASELAPRPTMTVSPFPFSVDTVPPPASTAPVLSAYSDSGTIGDNTTRFRNINFTGNATALLSVQLYNGSAGLGGAKASASGTWSATTTSLADGVYTIGAAVLDTAGNKSQLSPTVQITIDGTAPATPAAPALDPSSDTAPAGDNTTTVSTPVVTGTAATDVSLLMIYSDSALVGTATPDASRNWRFTLPSLSTGVHSIQVKASDLADNASALSTALGLTIGTSSGSAPSAPALNSATAGNGSVSLSWSAPSSDGGSAVSGYKVYRATSSGNETLLTTLGTGTGWTDTSVTNGTTYYYQVSAVNSVGESSRSSERSATPVAPATAPGAPSLALVAAGNLSVNLSWNAPNSDGGSAITGYRVYRGTSSGGETLLTTLGTSTSFLDTSVLNGSTYYYQVSAINAVGEGPRSAEWSATPLAPATAPGTPTLNSATAGNGSVSLSWSAPSDGGSAITGYKLYRGTSSGGEILWANLGTATSWTDTNAANGTTYYYQVAAVNSVGEGSRSSERSATPAAPATVPSTPTLNTPTAGNGSVALTWTAPANNGAAITGYKVYRGTSSGNETLWANLGTGTSWTDTNAANGTTYYYQVSAVNSVGEGARSNERSATPAAPATVPATPTLNTPSAGSGSVSLSWSAPSDGGSAITGYKLYRGTSSGGEILWANLGTATGWTDTGVNAGTTYYYQVSAINSVGEGLRSNERSATPAAAATAPGTPTLNSASSGTNSVALAWSAPSDGGSAITGYRIYRATASGGETALTTIGNATGWTDTGVNAGTTYYYQVSAINSVGEGLRSNERSATPTTAPTAPGAPSLSPATAGNGSVALTWTAPANNGAAITGYKVYRGTSSGNETLWANLGTGTNWTDTSAANGTTYYYQVSAVNSVGEGARSNERSATPAAPATAPASPSLNVPSAGNASVFLSWSAPSDGGAAITGYKVYRGTSSGNESLYANLGTGTSWTDTNASNGTTYYYQVSAVNSVGEGPRSSERSATPAAPATAPAAPSLNAPSAGNGSVSLSWSAPSDGGSAITGYKLYRGTSSGGEILWANLGTATSWTDTNAANGTTYYYQVAAVNSVGESARSAERSATPSAPASAPGIPALNSATAGSGSVTLSWSAPSDGGSAITGYRIYRATTSGGEILLTTVGTSTNWTDTGVTNGTTYYYQVSAVNSIGEGLRSSERSATPTTAPTAPGAPSLGSATAGNGSVALAWSAPTSNGGAAVSGYKVYRGTASGNESLYTTLGNVTGWTDTGATNGTTYYYQVSAVNSVGEGARSSERSATPAAPATAPGAPTLGSATASAGSIALSWSAPSDGGSAITGYRIYRGTASGGETLLTTVGTGTSWTDTGLPSGTTYYYQVSAVNSVGEGARSSERSATTPSSGDTTAPSTPTNMTTLLSGTTGVVIDWANANDNVGVTGYQVYRDGILVSTTPNSWFVDSDLGASTTHTYQVRAIDAAGNRSAASVTMSASTVGYGIGTNGTLSGVVFDSAGNVVTNAVARVVGTTKMVRTDRNGVWMFQLMAPGTYSITATYTSTVTFSITAVSKQTAIAAATLP